ncbi:hypothetical protein [Aquibacillus sediminis]|uniref:hypothetical protein n=1 Tax=Aquibacillus sediminis TaxID=2574734 RepID=UPI001107D955|nr:hypothetical protein [Aquibacillus sediminis]
MKYIYLILICSLLFWETDQLQDIFNFSVFWQYLANILLVGYFAYLLEIPLSIKKLIHRKRVQ